MNRFIWMVVLAAGIVSCNKPEEVSLREKTYNMHPANLNSTQGTVVFTELAPAKLQVEIILSNTVEGIDHPAHLHFGSVREVGELATLLNPVDGATGKSVTILDQVKLSSGQLLTYELLGQMNGSVKVHMNDTYFKHLVLTFGNIGQNEDYFFDGTAVCTGH